jgi:hypothetical protein
MEKFLGTKDEKREGIKEKFCATKDYTVTFRQNRTFELKLGRNEYRFTGRESKNMSKEQVDHPDFTEELKKYFVIKEQ